MIRKTWSEKFMPGGKNPAISIQISYQSGETEKRGNGEINHTLF